MFWVRTEVGHPGRSVVRRASLRPPLRRLLVVAAVGLVIAGCSSGAGSDASPGNSLQRDFAKVLDLRATSLEDLHTVSKAVTAVESADAAALVGDTAEAVDLVATAATLSAAAAPIVARARTDVFAYQTALTALEQEARKATAQLTDDQRAKVVALCTTGRTEADATRATAAAYAAEWSSYADIVSNLQTWLQRSQKGQYVGVDATKAAYQDLTVAYRDDLAIGRASADAADMARSKATEAMDASVVSVRAAVADLGAAPTPTPSPSRSGASSTRPSPVAS